MTPAENTMETENESISFSFGEEVSSFKLHLPRNGEISHYIEAFNNDGKSVGFGRLAAPPDSTFHIWVSQTGDVVVTYH